jgi:hypothetical protein
MIKKIFFVARYDNYEDEIVRLAQKGKNKVCYITFNKSCEYLMGRFRERGFDEKKFYFVDVITEVVSTHKEGVANCHFVGSASDLDGILKNVVDAVGKGFNVIVIDSLSNILLSGASFEKICGFFNNFSGVSDVLELNVFCNKEDREKMMLFNCFGDFEEKELVMEG